MATRKLRRAVDFLFVAAVVAGALVSLQVRQAEAGPEPSPPPPSQNEKVQYCLLFGVGDAEPARWDGSIQARGARILQLDGWRLDEGDSLQKDRWTLATRRVILSRRARSRGVEAAPVLENGVYVTAEILDADARFTVQTKQVCSADLAFSADPRPLLKSEPANRTVAALGVRERPLVPPEASTSGVDCTPAGAVRQAGHGPEIQRPRICKRR